jgi:hypothetical protein
VSAHTSALCDDDFFKKPDLAAASFCSSLGTGCATEATQSGGEHSPSNPASSRLDAACVTPGASSTASPNKTYLCTLYVFNEEPTRTDTARRTVTATTPTLNLEAPESQLLGFVHGTRCEFVLHYGPIKMENNSFCNCIMSIDASSDLLTTSKLVKLGLPCSILSLVCLWPRHSTCISPAAAATALVTCSRVYQTLPMHCAERAENLFSGNR